MIGYRGKFKFIGETESLGYQPGRVYRLHIIPRIKLWPIKTAPTIWTSYENPHGRCPYDSWEAFERNWVQSDRGKKVGSPEWPQRSSKIANLKLLPM